MRVSEQWLREWVNPDLTTEELAQQLSLAGLEVDAVEPVAPAFHGVVVGRVVNREPHPDADKLSLCQVDVGQAELLQIVCGAPNVAAGQLVPVAQIGAELPGGFKIKAARLRGVESQGMICSAAELGLAEQSDGIWPLPADAEVGRGFREWLQLADHSIEIDLTPNRGDCLSISGLARDLAAINGLALTPPGMPRVEAGSADRFPVEVTAPQACPRYCGRIVRGVNVQAETPLWMRERLRRCGIRSLGPVVDVTNYVMLELGQPMHAFDLARLEGGIRVRLAEQGEKLKLLDGTEISLAEDVLVIADHRQPLALAGIMGGEGSGVTDDTRDVLLESAFFSPLAIAGRARRYGLFTDSSQRFERGVDSELQTLAMERATDLLQQIAGGEAGPVVEVASAADLPKNPPIRLRRARIAMVLGGEVDDARVEAILRNLGMTMVPTQDGWEVLGPSHRFDIAIEADLIEEVARIQGYHSIPETLPSGAADLLSMPERSFDLNLAKDTLVARGYQEVITYSFVSPELTRLITPAALPVVLANPISADMSMMRASLWPGLIDTLTRNLARQQERLQIFETGLRFLSQDNGIKQDLCIAGLLYGNREREHWSNSKGRQSDFYDLKADVEALLGLARPDQEVVFERTEQPVLHPGQSAQIRIGERIVGVLGMLHPALQSRLDLAGDLFLFEVWLEELAAGRLPKHREISRFPAVRRDLAIVVDRDLPYAAVREVVRRAAPDFLRDLELFDLYQGVNVGANRKSLALRLIFQDSSRTLTEVDIEQAVTALLAALGSDLGAELRT